MGSIWMGWIKRESGAQGYGAIGDGGRAYGLYQFDYRYALIPFLRYLVSVDSRFYEFQPYAKYAQGSAQLINNSALHELFRKWAKDARFCAAQDDFAIEQYYKPAADYMRRKWGMDADAHSAVFRGSLFSMSIRSGQENGAARMHQNGTEVEILRKAYATYGNEDAGRWPAQLADALRALAEEKAAQYGRNWLQIGDVGNDVKTMQEMLIRCGYDCGSAGADGDFGKDTERAVKAFQLNMGLFVDGQYGEQSASILLEVISVMGSRKTKPDFTAERLTQEIEAVYKMAHNGGYVYSDSTVLPPCADHKISCDRLEARALWNLGMTDQRKGGEVCSTFPAWFEKHGFEKITDKKRLKCGDMVFVDDERHNNTPDWKWHMFTIKDYNPKSGMCHKFDCGSNARIRANQPFYVQLEEWGGAKRFRFAYRTPYLPSGPLNGTYVIESAVNRNFAVDVKSASTATGANVQLYKKNGTQAQTFILEHVKDGYYRIRNVKSGKVLDVTGGKALNRTNVQQYVWNETKAQLWKPEKNADGSYTFVSALNKSYVLDLSGANATNGRNIWIYKKNGTKAQEWFLVKK